MYIYVYARHLYCFLFQSWIYDVCVSFRDDTPATFTSHLYTCLANANVNFFKDDEEIIRGDRISVSLLQAIEKSRISIVVLSKYYAGSRWCLQELEKIMECHKTIGQVVVPVFFGVDSFTVCNQTGMFGEAFQELLETFSVASDKEKSWRTALREVDGIAGIVITDFRYVNVFLTFFSIKYSLIVVLEGLQYLSQLSYIY